jgi:hypothetical protein
MFTGNCIAVPILTPPGRKRQGFSCESGCLFICFSAPGSHASADGLLDRDRLPLAFTHSQRCTPLPSLVRMDNDFRQGRIRFHHAGIQIFDINWPGRRDERGHGSCLRGAIGAAAGAAAGKRSPATFRIVATLMVSALAIFTQWENQRFDLIHAFLRVGQKNIPCYLSIPLIRSASGVRQHDSPCAEGRTIPKQMESLVHRFSGLE